MRLPLGGEKVGTLEDLLSHKVGIVPNAYDTRLEDGGDPAEIRKDLGKLKRICPVGECHTYQNVAFDAVAEVVAAVSGKTFETVVKAELFDQLGMQDGSYGLEALTSSGSWAEPYRKRRADARPVRRTLKQSYYRVPAAGGVNGSISDLARFAQAQMGLQPDILDADTLIELHTPRIYTRREQSSVDAEQFRAARGREEEGRHDVDARPGDAAILAPRHVDAVFEHARDRHRVVARVEQRRTGTPGNIGTEADPQTGIEVAPQRKHRVGEVRVR